MSDDVLRYVPIDPGFLPTSAAAHAAELELKLMLPHAESVQSSVSEHVAFVDAGENWEGVSCPACGNDAEGWWSAAMDRAAAKQFEDLSTPAQCCGAVVSLNEMHYPWRVAFGRFVLEALNPSSVGLTESELELIGEKVGCRVREVKARI